MGLLDRLWRPSTYADDLQEFYADGLANALGLVELAQSMDKDPAEVLRDFMRRNGFKTREERGDSE
jgi:hypothetical protein